MVVVPQQKTGIGVFIRDKPAFGPILIDVGSVPWDREFLLSKTIPSRA